MPTSDERREVAKALRGDPVITGIEQTRDGFEGMTYHEAAYRFWDMCRRVQSVCKADIAYSTCSVLADLIDPTCHVVPGDSDNHAPHCSACGAVLYVGPYCPHCGARVVEDDGE